MTLDTLDIFILNYNGWELLSECLPSVIVEAKNYPGRAGLFVIDNSSTDDSVKNLSRDYPAINIIKNSKNDYLFSYNDAISKSNAEYVMVLNNDVKLETGCLSKLLSHFKRDKTLFAVQPLLLNWDGKGMNAGQRYCISGVDKGFFEFGTSENITIPSYTLCASGGACIYNKNKFLALGGYDELFYPGYYEDSDITWRALIKGWASIFVPTAKGYHINHASWGKVKNEEQLNILIKAHQLIFMWRHMNGIKFWFRHIVMFLPRLILWDYINGKFIWTKATIKAMVKINLIIKRRLHNPQTKNSTELINSAKATYVYSM